MAKKKTAKPTKRTSRVDRPLIKKRVIAALDRWAELDGWKLSRDAHEWQSETTIEVAELFLDHLLPVLSYTGVRAVVQTALEHWTPTPANNLHEIAKQVQGEEESARFHEATYNRVQAVSDALGCDFEAAEKIVQAHDRTNHKEDPGERAARVAFEKVKASLAAAEAA